jgi:hypothetical protein
MSNVHVEGRAPLLRASLSNVLLDGRLPDCRRFMSQKITNDPMTSAQVEADQRELSRR